MMSEERVEAQVSETEEQTVAATEPTTEVNETVDQDTNGLKARIEQLERKSAEHRDQWLRAVADYKNFKRRSDAERIELIRGASADLLLKLLPVMDDLERALDSVTPEIAASAWYGGFRLIPQKLATILESQGITPINAVGSDFDPNLHEAVIYEEIEGQEGKVVSDLQRGYRLRERVLRPSMVKVGKM